MLPTVYDDDLTREFSIKRVPSKTFKLQPNFNIIRGVIDGLQAVEQAIYLILNTERYEWLIYSWNYGVELQALVGMPTRYCMAEIQRRISEALLQDDRITKVHNFEFTVAKRKVLTTFTVVSVFGEINAELEVGS